MTVVVPGGPAGADRHAQAHAALRAAELRTGVRRERRQHTLTVAAAPAVPAPTREGARHRVHHRTDHQVALAGRRLPVHPDLARLLPEGGLTTGSTVVVRGSTTLLLALLAEASRAGAWTAIVGHPAAGMAAAADAGLDLDRTVTVPAPGPDAPAVVAALLDGLDVVVLGPRTALLDADRRRLVTRARERGAVLVAVDAQPGAHVVLDTRAGTWSGLDHGSGWLRRRTLTVRRTGRGAAARPVELEVEVPLRADVVVPGREHTARPRLHVVGGRSGPRAETRAADPRGAGIARIAR